MNLEAIVIILLLANAMTLKLIIKNQKHSKNENQRETLE